MDIIEDELGVDYDYANN